MKVGRWSTVAGSNNATPPDGFPEGQAASTLNDCARELMAAIRTVFQDAQFFDQDLSPTYVNATTFTVPGDQTSAIHSGRRLKVFDASTMFATVVTASYTALTTIQIATDSGSNLTNSLSSFAIGLQSRLNSSFPQGLSISAAVVNASAVNAQNTPKAWVNFQGSSTGTLATIKSSFNVSSVSRSAAGVYRINFTTALSDTNYAVVFQGANTALLLTYLDNITYSAGLAAASYKFGVRGYILGSGSAGLYDPTDTAGVSLVFYR